MTAGKRWHTYVEVEVDITDLVEHGWHQEDDCPESPALRERAQGLAGAAEALHRQAHPSEPWDIWLCRLEPCRSLTWEELRAAP